VKEEFKILDFINEKQSLVGDEKNRILDVIRKAIRDVG
jgi:hypothetical protein